MAKPVAIDQCYLCGTTGECTDEHVIPACLFVEERPSEYVILPACRTCNADLSKDDENFRDFIATKVDPSGQGKMWEKIRRSLERPQAAGRRKEFLSRTTREAGATPGAVTITSIKFEGERINRTLRRILWGLYFKHVGQFLNNAYMDGPDFYQSPISLRSLTAEIGQELEDNLKVLGQVQYSWAAYGPGRSTYWYLSFNNKITFLTCLWDLLVVEPSQRPRKPIPLPLALDP